MKILIIDPHALSLDWAMRCKDDGHKVKWYTKLGQPMKYNIDNVGKGLVDRIDNIYEWFKWPDLVFYPDNDSYLELVAKWRKAGVPVIGCTPESAAWESDRKVGMKVLKDVGIEIPPTKEFKDYESAIGFVRKTMLRYAAKSDSPDKSLSYCAKTPADMVFMLERWKKLDTVKDPFVLQEFKSGTEMAVGAWFGPGGFNRGWCENWEFKKLMNDDLGVATGEQGTVVRYVAKSFLARKVLEPLEDQLASLDYVGYIDVNCIIDDEGTPWPLEFTMRPGWPTFNIQQALHTGDHAEWLLKLSQGEDAKNFRLDEMAVGVCLSIPNYPYGTLPKESLAGIPLYGMTLQNENSIHPCEMMMGEAPHSENSTITSQPCLVTAGDYVLVASGTGQTVSEAKKQAYKVLSQISMPASPMYRTDIGNRLKKQIPKLQTMGYATGMKY